MGFGQKIVPHHRRCAGVGRDQRGEHPHEGGFAGAIRAQDGEDLADRHRQVDAVDRL